MTTDLTDDALTELERLEREATPGKWRHDKQHNDVRTRPTESYEESIANRAPIVALRNAAPQLLAELRASRERERRYYVALCELVARDGCDIARAALRGEK